MTIDNEAWHASIERIEIGPGLRVFLTDAEVRGGLTVEPRDGESEPWMASNVAVAGWSDIEMPDGIKTHVGPDHAVLFRPNERNPRYIVSPRQRLKIAGYALRADRLERVFDGNVPVPLRPLIEPKVEKSCVLGMAAPKALRNLGDALFAPGLNGPLRTLFIEGAVLQLLASQAAAGLPTASRTRLSERERVAVVEARERLLADMRSPPGLGGLAAVVGLTEKRLNAGFRSEFGATVYEVLRNERLAHARLALAEGGVSLKEIAFRVGYNHVTNFINAFTRRYGAPPMRTARRR
jgi:AraC-like DNA-binding protein